MSAYTKALLTIIFLSCMAACESSEEELIIKDVPESVVAEESVPEACVEIDIFTDDYWFSQSVFCAQIGTIALLDIETNIPPDTSKANAFVTISSDVPGECSLHIDEVKALSDCSGSAQIVLKGKEMAPARLMFIPKNPSNHKSGVKGKRGKLPKNNSNKWHKVIR